jgi:hypothetical protein
MPKPLPRSFSFQPRKSGEGKNIYIYIRQKTLGSTKLLLTFREDEISIPCDRRETNHKMDRDELENREREKSRQKGKRVEQQRRATSDSAAESPPRQFYQTKLLEFSAKI